MDPIILLLIILLVVVVLTRTADVGPTNLLYVIGVVLLILFIWREFAR